MASEDPPTIDLVGQTEFNLAAVHTAVERRVPERDCIVRVRADGTVERRSYREVGERTRRLANALRDRGLGTVVDRDRLASHESGQDHLAIYLHNGPEYLETMLGSYKARLAPFNVNYRYVAEELEYLLRDAGARAIVYHSAFAPTLAAVRDRLDDLDVLVQVDDDSGNGLLPGAEWYEDVVAASSGELPEELVAAWSPDDLYILYTGGTTGMPKGVLWRQADIFVAAMGGRRNTDQQEWTSYGQLADNAADGGAKLLPGPPFMHGAAHWVAFNFFTNGNTIVLPAVTDRLDAADILGAVDAEDVNVVLIVGDAFGRPLADAIESALEEGTHDLSSLLAIASGGAALSPGVKQRLLAALPSIIVMDGLGASETGQQGTQLTTAGQAASTGDFSPGPGMCILSEELTSVLPPGHPELGWLGQSGRVPLGYLGDEDKTARTFPVIEGVRYAVPGDRARLTGDGRLELFGRDAVTINSGGEKIFAEEVEQAILRHGHVRDCVVAGRPSPRWGSEVVAIVAIDDGAAVTDEEILLEAGRHIARYKLPKAIIRRDHLQRSPSGKADYRWARDQAAAASEDPS
ncbi:MAG: acyl-CoA synthetase [Actinobacteria bacterium]|nr:acyl-CoA synthetase [Actinomycetota bacterium]